MQIAAGLAILSLAVTACTSNEAGAGNGRASIDPASPVASATVATNLPTASAPTTPGEASPLSTSQPAEMVTFDWPAGTVTCAQMEGNFPNGVDDHAINLDQGLVSYHRAVGADSVEEVFVQFLNDPTCTVDSGAWIFLISYLLDDETLYRSGHLCGFYWSVQEADPPPANLQAVLTQLANAERLCS